MSLPLPPAALGLIHARNALRDHYSASGLDFTLDGNLLGDLGEALAQEYFGLRLTDRNGAGIDGHSSDGRSVQVKVSASGRGAAFRNTETRADHLLFFALDIERECFDVLYNGPEENIVAYLPASWPGQRSVSRNQLIAENAKVADAERLPLVMRDTGNGDAQLIAAIEEEHSNGSFSHKLLEAIVRAYPLPPSDSRGESRRIGDATRALFGARADYQGHTDAALKFMAERYIEDRGGPGRSLGPDPYRWLNTDPPSAASVASLAQEAAEKFGIGARNLENLFSERKLALCRTVLNQSDVSPTVRDQALRTVKDIFQLHGIRMRLDE